MHIDWQCLLYYRTFASCKALAGCCVRLLCFDAFSLARRLRFGPVGCFSGACWCGDADSPLRTTMLLLLCFSTNSRNALRCGSGLTRISGNKPLTTSNATARSCCTFDRSPCALSSMNNLLLWSLRTEAGLLSSLTTDTSDSSHSPLHGDPRRADPCTLAGFSARTRAGTLRTVRGPHHRRTTANHTGLDLLRRVERMLTPREPRKGHELQIQVRDIAALTFPQLQVPNRAPVDVRVHSAADRSQANAFGQRNQLQFCSGGDANPASDLRFCALEGREAKCAVFLRVQPPHAPPHDRPGLPLAYFALHKHLSREHYSRFAFLLGFGACSAGNVISHDFPESSS